MIFATLRLHKLATASPGGPERRRTNYNSCRNLARRPAEPPCRCPVASSVPSALGAFADWVPSGYQSARSELGVPNRPPSGPAGFEVPYADHTQVGRVISPRCYCLSISSFAMDG